MELFTVNRYDTIKRDHDPEKEKRILEKLQKNIEQKKKNLEKEQKKPIINEAETIQENENVVEEPTVEQMEVDETAKEINENLPKDEEMTETAAELKKDDFMVLGKDATRRKNQKEIDMVLPPWLAYPTVISKELGSDERIPVDSVNYLSDNLKKVLKEMNIIKLFPVQEEVIPWILDAHKKPHPFRPRDICVSAPTGSGKTLAYAVPIVQHLSTRINRKIRALIVLPVNELAIQVFKVFHKLCASTTLTCANLSKFVPFETEQSHLIEEFNGELYSKVDIVITTTGRLVEHIHSTKGFSLKSLKFLVIDEADRIMEQIHNNWLYHLDSHVKKESDSFLSGHVMPLCYGELCNEISRQPHKLLFSATLSQDPEKLQNLSLFQPKLFTAIVGQQFNVNAANLSDKQQRGEFIGKFTTPAELTEKYCMTQIELKPLTLFALIKENNWNRFLCFANSGEVAHRLSFVLQKLLGNAMKIEELSANLPPSVRHSVLGNFKTGKINGLICSDALARGVDIENVDIVISYDAPRHVKTYVHRIGRTARAGKQGLAVTLMLESEQKTFQKILQEAGKSDMKELTVNSNQEEEKAKDYANIVEDLQIALKREQQTKIQKISNEKQQSLDDTQQGIIQQLQSKLQNGGFQQDKTRNIPESWKIENLTNKELPRKLQRNNKKKPTNKFAKKVKE